MPASIKVAAQTSRFGGVWETHSRRFLEIDDRWPQIVALPETNIIAPETRGVEDEFPFGARPTDRCEVLVFGGGNDYNITSL